MRRSHSCYTLVLAVLSLACTFQFQAHAAPPGFFFILFFWLLLICFI
jgi:hypothetical protein